MSPIEKLSSTPNPAVLLLDFESAPAGLEESLAATLPEATRSRITAFCHPVRRRQTRWGRILAGAAARILDAELVEEPPHALSSQGRTPHRALHRPHGHEHCARHRLRQGSRHGTRP